MAVQTGGIATELLVCGVILLLFASPAASCCTATLMLERSITSNSGPLQPANCSTNCDLKKYQCGQAPAGTASDPVPRDQAPMTYVHVLVAVNAPLRSTKGHPGKLCIAKLRSFPGNSPGFLLQLPGLCRRCWRVSCSEISTPNTLKQRRALRVYVKVR